MATAARDLGALLEAIYAGTEPGSRWEAVQAALTHHFEADASADPLLATEAPSSLSASGLYARQRSQPGVGHLLVARLELSPGQVHWEGVLRAFERGPFPDDAVHELNRLAPHLLRALRMRREAGALLGQRAELQDLVDRLAPAALVLDAAGRIVCAGAQADAQLRARDGIADVGGRLSVRCRSTQAALLRALGEAAACPRAEPTVLQIPREHRAALKLTVLPMVSARADNPGRALALLQPPELAPRLDPELVSRLYRLTPAEAQLAVALTEGCSLQQFARQRGRSEHTVRTQLKALFEKTETRRQAELVRLLLTGGARLLAQADAPERAARNEQGPAEASP